MKYLSIVILAYLTLITSAAMAQSLSTSDLFEKFDGASYSIAPNPWRREGLLDRIKDAWVPISSCEELTLSNDHFDKIYYLAARVSDTEFVDLACAMENAGNRVSKAAIVVSPDEPNRRFYFYWVVMADGAEVVLNAQMISGNSFRDDENRTYAAYGHYASLHSVINDEVFDDPYYGIDPNKGRMRGDYIGSVDGDIVAFLLGNKTIDISHLKN